MNYKAFKKLENSITGETSTGKKIYNGKLGNDPAYAKFTAEEHIEAAEWHRLNARNWRNPKDQYFITHMDEAAKKVVIVKI